jgi:hypothetical protein
MRELRMKLRRRGAPVRLGSADFRGDGDDNARALPAQSLFGAVLRRFIAPARFLADF